MKLSDIKPAYAEAFARFVKFCEQEKIADSDIVRDNDNQRTPDMFVAFDDIELIDLDTYAARILENLKAEEVSTLPRQLRIFADALEALERDKFVLLNFDMHDIALCKIT